MNDSRSPTGSPPHSASRKKYLLALAIALVAGAGLLAAWELFLAPDSDSPNLAYYSADDGATFFTDKADRVVPYSLDGKTVVAAHVFAQGGTPKVAYLSRYTADRIKAEQQPGGAGQSEPHGMLRTPADWDKARAAAKARASGVEVKPPGKGDWVNRTDPAADGIINGKWPNGADRGLELLPS